MDVSVHAKLRNFIAERMPRKDDEAPINESDSLFLSGRLSSFDALELIVFLETEFSIDFAEIDFEQSQLDSIEAITNLIGAYRTQIGGP